MTTSPQHHIHLSILISFTASLFSRRFVVDHVSAPYSNAGLTTVLYVFPFSLTGIFLSYNTPLQFPFLHAALTRCLISSVSISLFSPTTAPRYMKLLKFFNSSPVMFNSFPVMFNSFHVIFTSSPVISILSLLFQFLPCYFNSSLDIFTVVCLSAGLKVTGGKMTHHGYLGAFITKVKKGSIADTVGHLHAGKYDPTELGRNCSGKITHL